LGDVEVSGGHSHDYFNFDDDESNEEAVDNINGGFLCQNGVDGQELDATVTKHTSAQNDNREEDFLLEESVTVKDGEAEHLERVSDVGVQVKMHQQTCHDSGTVQASCAEVHLFISRQHLVEHQVADSNLDGAGQDTHHDEFCELTLVVALHHHVEGLTVDVITEWQALLFWLQSYLLGFNFFEELL
jgi:hypothetical protein